MVDDQGSFYIYYGQIAMELKREYTLFDETAIVASVGGSLSLFLGFSCFGLISKLIKTVMKYQRNTITTISTA